MKSLSIRFYFFIMAFFNAGLIIYMFFAECADQESQSAKSATELHFVKLDRFINHIAKEIYSNVRSICNKVITDDNPSQKVLELNSRNKDFLLYWLDYDGVNYKMDYNIEIEGISEKFAIGKAWIKKDDANKSTHYILPVATVLKNQKNSGVLILHISLERFKEDVHNLIKNDKRLRFGVLNHKKESVFNFNLEPKISTDFINHKISSVSSYNLKDLHYSKAFLLHMSELPLDIYYLYENKTKIFDYSFFLRYIVAVIFCLIIWFVLYIILSNDLRTLVSLCNGVAQAKGHLFIKELDCILTKIVFCLKEMGKYQKKNSTLVKKNQMLNDIAQSYLENTEKMNTELNKKKSKD